MASRPVLYLASCRMTSFPTWTLRVAPLTQRTARRNAQQAAIVCAQRRRERDDVERFLARQDATAADMVRQLADGRTS